ncbi:hypothetical protein [Nocardia vaccinii]|uniref:hypothetical protein n=1 Tax=Nocardia vaccinii TaxID=1822 RepID=UPI000B3179C8|nr:hypothetical protein [Nocardia vaccinii]
MSTTHPASTPEILASQPLPVASQPAPAAVERTLTSLYLTTAVPPWLRDGPVTQTYGRRAAHDAIAAARLREVQNLAAITAGHVQGVTLDDDPDTQQQLLAAALGHACQAAAATGIADEHIQAARDLGESGVPWVHAPAHRHLGRIEQLTAELAAAHTSSTVLALVAAQALQREHHARTAIATLRDQLTHPAPTIASADAAPAERAAPRLWAVPTPQETPGGDARLDGAGIGDAVAATALEETLPAWDPGAAPGGPDTGTGARPVGQEVEL